MTSLRISSCIRMYRQTHALSQTAFGELLGVSAQSVSKWEKEICCPDITLLLDLARILGVSVEYLLGGERDCAESCEFSISGSGAPTDLAAVSDR